MSLSTLQEPGYSHLRGRRGVRSLPRVDRTFSFFGPQAKPYNQRMIAVTTTSRAQRPRLALLKALVASVRPMSSVLALAMTSLVIWAKDGLSLRCVLAGAAMFLLTAFGFQVNDILDYRKDVAAQVRRPIAAGVLRRKDAAVYAVVLLICTFSLAAWVRDGWLALAVTAIALLLYTPAARRFPLVKGLYVAALCIVPLYYGAAVCHAIFAWRAYALLAAFMLGRETLMDANEALGDGSAGLLTVAVVLGRTPAKWIGISLMMLADAGEAVVAAGWFAKGAALAALLMLSCLFAWPHLEDSRRVELSRIPMLAAALAVACG
jgi:4-hydroxybenzoate polyprenyltransferase